MQPAICGHEASVNLSSTQGVCEANNTRVLAVLRCRYSCCVKLSSLGHLDARAQWHCHWHFVTLSMTVFVQFVSLAFRCYCRAQLSWSTESKVSRKMSAWWRWKMRAGRRRTDVVPLAPTFTPTQGNHTSTLNSHIHALCDYTPWDYIMWNLC